MHAGEGSHFAIRCSRSDYFIETLCGKLPPHPVDADVLGNTRQPSREVHSIEIRPVAAGPQVRLADRVRRPVKGAPVPGRQARDNPVGPRLAAVEGGRVAVRRVTAGVDPILDCLSSP